MGKKNFTQATTWRKEIISKSRSLTNIFLLFLGVLILIYLCFTAGINVLFPKSGSLQIFQIISIDSTTKNILSTIAAIIGFLFSLGVIPPVRKWYTPKKLNYRAAADAIIDDLKEEDKISNDKQQRLREINVRTLGALETPESKADTEEMMIRAITEMAKVVGDT
jgi:hypothetical protein